MRKKGFTLVELLSVIVLLGIISVIIIPNFTNIIKTSEEDLYNKQIEVIKVSAKLWTLKEDNKIILSENTSWPYIITLGDLQDLGLIEEVKNPKTDDYFSDSTIININYINGKYTFEVKEDYIDNDSNIIILNGERNYKQEINTTYIEPGYSASINGNDITSNVIKTIYKNGIEVSNIDTSTLSNYTVHYKVSYQDNGLKKQSIVIRRIKIVDTIPPVITCANCSNLTIESISSYELPKVSATDNSNETIQVIKIGSFSSIIPGEKKITYVATDSSGNSSSYELVLNVVDTIPPIINDIIKTLDTSNNNIAFKYIIKATDTGSGIKEYSFDGGITWQKSNEYTFNYSVDQTRTLMVKDNSDNITSKQVVEEYIINKEYLYDYTGSEQVFTVPESGYYKLETWGAQGGTSSGGYGGYSRGTIYLTKGDKLYINVGGIGLANNGQTGGLGGYNGGGAGGLGHEDYPLGGAGGGGATHIAITSGLLSNLSSSVSKILIVAGGGGGGTSWNTNYHGGSGGGISGGIGELYNNGTVAGGNQSTGNAFGKGADGVAKTVSNYGAEGSGGGGGGFYGGMTASAGENSDGGGGGGSGYIGNTSLINKVMYCYNCTTSNSESTLTMSTINASSEAISNYAKSGNGYAKITYIGDKSISVGDSFDYVYTGSEQVFIVPKTGNYKLETWGAQGGGDTNHQGGYGGYSKGTIYLTKGTSLYINVGGKGESNSTITNIGGYNGGGYSGNNSGANSYGGGGATHIATVSGILSTLSDYKGELHENGLTYNSSTILIVSGGGAGTTSNVTTMAGSGGGYIGGAGTSSESTYNNSTYLPTGGTQTGVGFAYKERYGTFGAGIQSNTTGWGGGGGGGFYGGSTGHGTTGSGGSGYIGNSLLTDKVMYCYNCTESSYTSTKTISTTNISDVATSNYAKSGNGYAKITYIS